MPRDPRRRDLKRVVLLAGTGVCVFAILGLGAWVSDTTTSNAADQTEAATARPVLAPEVSVMTPPTSPALEVAGASTIPEVSAIPLEYGCAAALAYLAVHAKPGAVSYCPHYALGHSAQTQLTLTKGVASTDIYIAEPCPNAYRNEASNSWGHWEGKAWIGDYPDDPWGPC